MGISVNHQFPSFRSVVVPKGSFGLRGMGMNARIPLVILFTFKAFERAVRTFIGERRDDVSFRGRRREGYNRGGGAHWQELLSK